MTNSNFESMRFDEKVSYLIENLKAVPDELAEEGVDVLIQANETEYAVMLARDRGMIRRAIEILLDAGDYLWAALIAKNANLLEESKQIYKAGLEYYIDMEMYGRAVSAATALGLSPDEIDALYRNGIEVESRSMDLHGARAMIDSAMDSLEISILEKQDGLSQDLMNAIKDQRERMAKQDEAELDRKEGS
jgi:3-hydroxyisobutyrate dehydrogenase-like beta-hydroxyacid dehydrogenase